MSEALEVLNILEGYGKTTKILWEGEEFEPFVALLDNGLIRIGIKGVHTRDANTKEFKAVAKAVKDNPKMSVEELEDLLMKYDI